jgi:prefoldin subunit 5
MSFGHCIQQLRARKKELQDKQSFIIRDLDLENAIRAVDNDIEPLQRELAELARKTNREKSK